MNMLLTLTGFIVAFIVALYYQHKIKLTEPRNYCKSCLKGSSRATRRAFAPSATATSAETISITIN